MRYIWILLCLAVASPAMAQEEFIVKTDNEKFSGNESEKRGDPMTEWEESVILAPRGPCMLKRVQVYWDGDFPGTDTLWIVGDPAEGGYQPTLWVADYNKLTEPLVIQYDGTPGWKEYDVSGRNIHIDGHSRVVIQHRVQEGGPYFGQDSSAQANGSFLLNPFGKLFPQYNIPGEIMLATRRFKVRLVVTYDFPSNTGSQNAPKATMVDVAKAAGFVTQSNTVIDASRVSIADWNNDGFDDVFVGGQFFQNNQNGTFTNVTASFGVSASATAFADFNNDGLLDIYAANGGAADKIYRASGNGVYEDITEASGFSNPYPTVTPMWLDYDLDGHLDLFIANGRIETQQGEMYHPDQLWRNNGNSTFTRVTELTNLSEGEPSPHYDTWGASATDYNADGRPDIFVATYRLAPDLLYRNEAGNTFTEVAQDVGVLGQPTDDEGYYGHGVGTEWGDFNNDGYPDLAVGNLGHPDYRGKSSNPSLLYKNSGPPNFTFEDVHMTHGPKFFEMNAGLVWLDVDLDGNLDLWHSQYSYNTTAGDVYRRSRLYINQGPTQDYKLVDKTWDLGSNVHGAWTAARLDMDNDGDMDLFVASDKDAVKLFRNDVARRGRFLSFRLQGDAPAGVNASAIGTSVRVYANGKQWYRELMAAGGGTTSSQNSSILHFGVGDVATVDSVVARFPNGTIRKFENLETNRRYTIPHRGNITMSVAAASASDSGLELNVIDGRLSIGVKDGSFTGFEVRNILGQAVMNEVLQPVSRWSTSMEGLPSGHYLVTVRTSNGPVTQSLSFIK